MKFFSLRCKYYYPLFGSLILLFSCSDVSRGATTTTTTAPSVSPPSASPHKAHFSDFYEIIDAENFQIYSERLKEILEWGLQNSKNFPVEPRKGLLQSVAEDWPLIPGPIRQGLKKTNHDFVEIRDKRQKLLDEKLSRTREKIERGLQKKGFLVTYYMFNQDCNAMGAEDVEHTATFHFPRVRLALPHSQREIQNYLAALRNRKFNHMYVGVTQEFEPYGNRVVEDWLRVKGYEGFKVRSHRVLLGRGREVYDQAKKKMVNWEWNDAVRWVKFLEGEHGINVVSRIKCYGLFWTLNPLRKVLCHEKSWGKNGAVAAVALSTLQGHLLQGEERFCVLYEGGREGQVWLDLLSFSRGTSPLGSLLMPLIRPLQQRFFQDLGRAMQKSLQ